MKFLPLTVLCGLLFLCLILANRFNSKDIPASLVVYLWALLGSHAVAAFGLQRHITESNAYTFFYYGAMVVCAAFALQAARSLNADNALVKRLWGFQLGSAASVVLIEAVLLGWIGTAILLSLFAKVTSVGFAIRVALGLYLLSRSAMAFIFCAGFIHNRAVWISRNNWLPALPGIVIFTALALFLVRAQRDLNHQENPVAAIHAEQQLAMEEGQ